MSLPDHSWVKGTFSPDQGSPATAALEHSSMGLQITSSQQRTSLLAFFPQLIAIELPQLWSCMHCARNLKTACAYKYVSLK